MRRRLLSRVSLALVLTLTAACGSTNESNEADAGEAAPAADAGALAGGGAPATPGAPAAGSSTAGTGGAAAGPSASGGAVPSGATGQAARGPGARDTTPVKLGFVTINVAGAKTLLAGMGTEVSFGDGRKQAQAVIDHMNRNGGIGGRKVVPAYAEVDATAQDPAAEYVAACTKLTEDDRVFAIVTPLNILQGFVECAAKHRTITINVSFNPGDDVLLRTHKDWLFDPTLMSLDRGTKLLLDLVHGQGRLAKGAKVGVVTAAVEAQLTRVADQIVKPKLRAWGVPFVEQRITEDNANADITSAVLRFKSEGVNRVIFVAPSGLVQLQFMSQAEGQRFRPTYFFWDPDSARFVTENVPVEQAKRVVGFGALPVSNVRPAEFPTTPREKRCLDIMSASGEDHADRMSNLTQTIYCEGIWLFEAVAERIPGALTAEGWRAAYRALGSAYPPVTTFGVKLNSGRNDNASSYRLLGWNAKTGRITYTSGPRPAP